MIAGVDYSLRAPGIYTEDGHAYYVDDRKTSNKNPTAFLHAFKYPEYTSTPERFYRLADTLTDILIVRGVLKVYLEGYSMGSKGKVFEIAEGTGELKRQLWRWNIECHVVPPTTLKKFATGKGNAKKDAMVAQYIKDTGVDLYEALGTSSTARVSDIADSYFLMKYGEANESN